MRQAAALALAVILLARQAYAAPATVRVFEGKVLAEPKDGAAVLHTFAEGATVSVSEEATDGWRRVRLPDGKTGYIKDEEVRLSGAEEAPDSPTYVAEARPSKGTNAPVLIKDIDHLTWLVREDPLLLGQAKALQARSSASAGVGWGTLAVAVGMYVGAVAVGKECTNEPFGMTTIEQCKWGDKTLGLAVGGLGVSVVGLVIMLAVAPQRHEILDLINNWNARHGDAPLGLTP